MNSESPKKSTLASMHTAEHMLNQAMVRNFNCGRCFSAHINKNKSKCDYRFGRELTEKEIKDIEKNINEQISREQPVTEEFIPKKQASALYKIDRLPDDAPDMIRIIKIGDFDACPCKGEHASNTSELGEFKIISTGFNENVLRIRYKLNDK